MEYYTNDHHGLLEELLCLDYCTNQDTTINIPSTNDCFQHLSSYAPFGDELSPPDFPVDSSTFNLHPQTLPYDFTNGLQNTDTGAPCEPETPIFNIGQFCPLAAEINTSNASRRRTSWRRGGAGSASTTASPCSDQLFPKLVRLYGQNIDFGRRHRLHERAAGENQQIARGNAFGGKSIERHEHIQGCQT
ncbi:hypothetical protein SASPL_118596 [Salvia splendens]|uniref:Uncharacterized protein n=1 Tax=Salvia splendens TaxID=180675 RepID=A0A8X8XY15_SALSN|nr:hypothetical protein SASPL_118596 [Salvia splendens]